MGSSKQLFMEVREAEELGDQARQVLFGPSTGDYARQSAKLKERIKEYEIAERAILNLYQTACKMYHAAFNSQDRIVKRAKLCCYRETLICLGYTPEALDQISTDAYNAVNFGE